jgi:hypothetical protein
VCAVDDDNQVFRPCPIKLHLEESQIAISCRLNRTDDLLVLSARVEVLLFERLGCRLATKKLSKVGCFIVSTAIDTELLKRSRE